MIQLNTHFGVVTSSLITHQYVHTLVMSYFFAYKLGHNDQVVYESYVVLFAHVNIEKLGSCYHSL
jgi:hypothetical protein